VLLPVVLAAPQRFQKIPWVGIAKTGALRQNREIMSAEPFVLWFLAGLVLVLLEFAAPGLVLIFFGLGAWAASLTAWLGWTPALAGQLGVFAFASVALLLGLRRSCRGWFAGLSSTGDARATEDEFLDKEARVLSAILPGQPGKVEFKGATWNARATEPLQPGDAAIIVGRDGLQLQVRPR
jgi:membrane protein implicated in regulation of membrane protease activity